MPSYPYYNLSPLHLPSLHIEDFRGILNLSIPKLGRVTLIAGKNGVGKTTILDAVRIYAARGKGDILARILQKREEFFTAFSSDGSEIPAFDYETLFHGRVTLPGSCISIGPEGSSKQLKIIYGAEDEELLEDMSEEEISDSLFIRFGDDVEEIPISSFFIEARPPLLRNIRDDDSERPDFRCLALGPSLPTNSEIARFWDRVALKDDEDRAVQALQLIYNGEVSRIALVEDVGSEAPKYFRVGRRALVKISGQKRPVPLRSLGDGAVRLFGVALALANSQDGFLLIDEAENGIHHSVHYDYWKMVLKMAQENNVQVFATTHGWDCLKGFARAAKELDKVEGLLIRLEKSENTIRAVEYSEDELQIATDQDIEVR